MLAMQLVMNADSDKYGFLIKSYDQDFLSGENKYPKTHQIHIICSRGWNKHQHQRGPMKVRLSSNNNGEKDGTVLVNDGTKTKKKFPQCSRDNHKLADCYAKTHVDGTVLHVMGDVEEIDEEVTSELFVTYNICRDR